MYKFLCDLCGKEVRKEGTDEMTRLRFGYKLVGYYDFTDLCPTCGMWLYEFLNEEKNRRKT